MSTKKIALITGANKGIGLEAARQLGKQGITVLTGAREEAKANAAAAELRQEGLAAHGVVSIFESSSILSLWLLFRASSLRDSDFLL